jgi:hypothetical protein
MLVHCFWLFEFKFTFEFICLSSFQIDQTLFLLTPQPSPLLVYFCSRPNSSKSAGAPPFLRPGLLVPSPLHHYVFPAAAHHCAAAQRSTRPSRPNTRHRPPSLSPAARCHRQVDPTCHPRHHAVSKPDSAAARVRLRPAFLA